MKTIEISNLVIENFDEFYEGFRRESVLGGEYDGEAKTLRIFLEDDSTITEEDVRKYLEKPKVKLVFTKEKLSDKLRKQFKKDIPVLVDHPNRIEVLVDEADKELVSKFVKEKRSGFEEVI